MSTHTKVVSSDSMAIVPYQPKQSSKEFLRSEQDRITTEVFRRTLEAEKYCRGTIFLPTMKRMEMDNYLQRMVAEVGFRGAVLLKKEGQFFFCKAYGLKNAAELNTIDTRFCIGSMTKMITSIAIMRLFQAGKISSLDDPIKNYLPSKYYNKLFDGITIRHLLTHTSGLHSYGVFDEDALRQKLYFTDDELYKLSLINLFFAKHKITPNQFQDEISKYLPIEMRENYRGITVLDVLVHELNMAGKEDDQKYQKIDKLYNYIVDHLQELDIGLLFKPGTDSYYSNSGYFLLGQIIQKISETSSFETFIQKDIFDRLGMERTGFSGSYDAEVDARGFHRDDRTSPFTAINNTRVYSSKSNAAGGAFSTLRDLDKLDTALYDDSFLLPETREMMFIPHKANPSYGLGFCIEKSGEVAGHPGCNPGFNSYMMRDVKNRNLYLVLGNTSLEVADSLAIATQGLRHILFR